MRVKHPAQYLEALSPPWDARAHIAETRTIAPGELPFEFMMNALRLDEGFPVSLFSRHTGLPLNVCQTALEKAEASGLIERTADTLRPTDRGRRFLNELLLLFL